MRRGPRISFRFASHLAALVLVIGLAAAAATPVRAEIYKDLRVTLNSMLAGILGAPERAPRDLVINGQPLEFTPYQSDRSISDITDEWLRVLAVNTRPALPKSNDKEELTAVIAANMLIVPKTSRIRDDLAVVVRFFDGDGEAALDYLRRQDPANSSARAPIPGVTIMIRRPADAPMTEVLMSRFDDVASTLPAFAAPADVTKLPQSLRPPAGVEVLSDIGDRDKGHTSRTVVSKGTLSAVRWSDQRADLLARDGFTIETPPAQRGGVTALYGRRGSVEANVLYTRSKTDGRTVEVIQIRQPFVGGITP
ncbi:hypothetical protein [Rhizobium leguminosarum]|uniref:hypothetical protein n=1 Tax=Rhizobium leguminosarum TaxID=384 RepID=UPI0014410CD8|nr:hypothetical protein [Rhizobium leguminosarum]NKK62241.1 hypothetical protein [Rhizobium leguminosarum bv. viciae]NKK97719.1 hypothetical protein [Rhizobium leguminosarum bv. viciae]NKL04301.1 hypothetical protein [Rhizobium leguminosarum bv. viciae]NKL86613.1 hypothetical protein [Rhizobium leguminosarum bv. viciae]NKL89465.1 hypothetical protein [Rhizobium leguminosarum bv. viciae]